METAAVLFFRPDTMIIIDKFITLFFFLFQGILSGLLGIVSLTGTKNAIVFSSVFFIIYSIIQVIIILFWIFDYPYKFLKMILNLFKNIFIYYKEKFLKNENDKETNDYYYPLENENP